MVISKQDAAHLKDLYESEGYQSLIRLLEAQKIDTAVKNMQSTSLEQLWTNRGRVEQINWLIAELHRIYMSDKKGKK